MSSRMITNSKETDLVYDMIHKILLEKGYHIVRIRFFGKKVRTLQIMLEKPDGNLKISDCTIMSRHLSPLLEALEQEYPFEHLEISSPGIERPLTRIQDFINWTGYDIKIKFKQTIEGMRFITGILSGYQTADSLTDPDQDIKNQETIEEDHILIDKENETETIYIPISSVKSANLIMGKQLKDDLEKDLQNQE